MFPALSQKPLFQRTCLMLVVLASGCSRPSAPVAVDPFAPVTEEATSPETQNTAVTTVPSPMMPQSEISRDESAVSTTGSDVEAISVAAFQEQLRTALEYNSRDLVGQRIVITGSIRDFVVNNYDADFSRDDRRSPSVIQLSGTLSDEFTIIEGNLACEFDNATSWKGLRIGQSVTIEGTLESVFDFYPATQRLKSCRLLTRGVDSESGRAPDKELDAKSLAIRLRQREVAMKQLNDIASPLAISGKDGYRVSFYGLSETLGNPPRFSAKYVSLLETLSPVELDFGFEPLPPEFFEDIQKIQGLRALQFAFDPAQIPRLDTLAPSIEKLQISIAGNTTSANLSGIGQLRGLTELKIFAAPSRGALQLDSTFIEELSQLPLLRSLTITGAEWNAETLATLGKCVRLQILEITQINDDVAKGLEAWGNLDSLQLLRMEGPGLTGDALSVIPLLPMLRIAAFPRTAIDAAAADWFLRQKKLESVSLAETATGNDLAAAVIQLADLKKLRLSDTNITDELFDQVPEVRLQKIQYLYLTNCAISDDGLQKLLPRKLPRLIALDLSGTEVSAAHLAELETFPSLRNLYLTKGLSVPEDVIEQLNKRTPSVRTEFR